MSWYYAQDSDRRGPVSDSEFEALVANGTIKPETLVWQEGMPNWVPLATVPRAGATATAEGSPAPAALCSECGKMLPTDEMIRYEGRFICPTCKPIFFQKIKEGAAVTGQREYAGFWTRFAAVFIDGIIMQIAGFVIGLLIGFVLRGNDSAPIVASGISMIMALAYEIYFIGKSGATPGKMALKIRVIRADGSPLGYGLATGRYFAKFLSAFILLIGYIMAAFDEEKRALHDRICDTRVVRE